MRFRFPLAVALGLALTLSAFVSAPSADAATTAHRSIHHSRHYRHVNHHRPVHHAYRRVARHRVARGRVHRVNHHAAHRQVRHARYRHTHAAVHMVAENIAPAAAVAGPERIHFVAPMRGTRASLLRQNRRNAEEGLTQIQNQAQLIRLENAGKLVPLPASYALSVNPHLPDDRRFSRPWTAKFLADLARVHYERFHKPLQVNSAVRPASYQRMLLRVNGNAAPVRGPIASPHETGAAVDIGKRDMSLSEVLWMRDYLLPLQAEGKIDVEEEFYQACFHITVYTNYVPGPNRRHHPASTLLAAGIR